MKNLQPKYVGPALVLDVRGKVLTIKYVSSGKVERVTIDRCKPVHKLRNDHDGVNMPVEEPRLTQLIDGDDDAIVNARDAIDMVSHTSCDEFIITGNDGTPPMLNLQTSRRDLRDQVARAHGADGTDTDAALSSSLPP